MRSSETGRLVGSLIGVVGLFAISSATAGDFLPLLYFLGIIGISLLVLMAIVGGAWAGDKIQGFLTGRYFDLAFSRMAPSRTEVLPTPQDPYAESHA